MTDKEQHSISTSRGISADQMEGINAYGPFEHSIWASKDGTLQIGASGLLRRRSEFILKCIKACLSKHFTLDEVKTFSILDVGCYDGWILHRLSELPFRRLVGLDPRQKNITKGQKIRQLLNISCRVEFAIGDITSIGEEKFDIVICSGVLHHLESPADAIRRLRSACLKMLFIETICLSSNHMTKPLKNELEMKDLAYSYTDQICGIAGQKFETSYYDGSSNRFCVVSIPSLESLLMYMEVNGFVKKEIVAGPKSYKAAVTKNERPFNAVCLCALVGTARKKPVLEELNWAQDYERNLAKTVINISYLEPLYNIIHLKKIDLRRPLFIVTVLFYIYSPNWLSHIFRRLTKVWLKEMYALEIIKNLRFNPQDKLSIEYAKILYKKRDYNRARCILKAVTQKPNADWRTVYRSFYLLSEIYKAMGMRDEAVRYEELCLTCNPKYPVYSISKR